MKKYIHITKQDRAFIARAFNITERTVHNAIHFDDRRGSSDLAKKIRKLAMARGGIMMAVVPEIETFHDHDQVMRQYLPNGALIELDRKDDSCNVIFKGRNVKHYDNVMLSDIEGIQKFAGELR